MAVNPADTRAIVERVCARPDVLDACARRDLGAVIAALTEKRTGGLTQGKISELTGIPQGRLSEWKTGIREAKGVSTFLKFADGLALPPPARRALRIDSSGQSLAPAPRTAVDSAVSYPGSPDEAMRNASALWLIDLNDSTALQRGTADHRLWNDVSLRWLTDPGRMPERACRGGIGGRLAVGVGLGRSSCRWRASPVTVSASRYLPIACARGPALARRVPQLGLRRGTTGMGGR